MRRRPSRGLETALAAAVAATAMLNAGSAWAAEVSGVKLVLTRGPGAESCSNEASLADEVRARLEASSDLSRRLALVEVRVTREPDAYAATIRVEGESAGVRVLRAEGDTCRPLHDALMVALLAVFDANAWTVSAPALPSPPMREAPKVAPTQPVPARAETPAPQLWIAAGGAVTHGLPIGFSAAVLGDVQVRVGRWSVDAGGYGAPERSIALSRGSVQLLTWGGRAQTCYAMTSPSSRIRAGACVQGALSALQGAGIGLDTNQTQHRLWAMAGAGADLEIRLSSRLAIGFEAVALATVHREAFSVQPVGTVFDTDPVVAWLDADLRVRIW